MVNTAYDVSQWTDFFVMVGGAAVVLVGLLFVVFAIRVEQSGSRDMRSGPRAAVAFLCVVLMGAAAGLIPGQSHAAIGSETAVIGAAGLGVYIDDIRFVIRDGIPSRLRRWGPGRIASLAAQIWGGVSVAVGHGGGWYVAAAGTAGLLVSSIQSAWWALKGAASQPQTEPPSSAPASVPTAP